jgi:nucleotide-binding universal stress UspA family protein
MTVQSILVGLDWGETVRAVAETTVELAVLLDASVKAIYIEDLDLVRATEQAAIPGLPPSGTIPAALSDAEDLADEFQDEERVLGKHFLRLVADARIRGSFLVERGDVAPILIRESRAHDLLVMGKYSEHPPEGARSVRPLGAHVEQVLRRVWCPILLVPPGGAAGSRYLVCYDGSPASYRAMAAMVRLARSTHGELEVLAVAEGEAGDRLAGEAEAFLAAHLAIGRIAKTSGDPVNQVLGRAEKGEVDMVSLGFSPSARHKRALDAVQASEILRELKCPALVCGPADEE